MRHVGGFGISVLRCHWGAGIGTALLDGLIDWARSGGVIGKINLTVRPDNSAARALYRRRGFCPRGGDQPRYLHRRRFSRSPDDGARDRDAVRMNAISPAGVRHAHTGVVAEP